MVRHKKDAKWDILFLMLSPLLTGIIIMIFIVYGLKINYSTIYVPLIGLTPFIFVIINQRIMLKRRLY